MKGSVFPLGRLSSCSLERGNFKFLYHLLGCSLPLNEEWGLTFKGRVFLLASLHMEDSLLQTRVCSHPTDPIFEREAKRMTSYHIF